MKWLYTVVAALGIGAVFAAADSNMISVSGRITGPDVSKTMPVAFSIVDSRDEVKLWSRLISVRVDDSTGVFYTELSDTAGADQLMNGLSLDAALTRVEGTAVLLMDVEKGKNCAVEPSRMELTRYPRAVRAFTAANVHEFTASNSTVTVGDSIFANRVSAGGGVTVKGFSAADYVYGYVEDPLGTLTNHTGRVRLYGGVSGWTNGAFSPGRYPPPADLITTCLRLDGTYYSLITPKGEPVGSSDILVQGQLLSYGWIRVDADLFSRPLASGIYRITKNTSNSVPKTPVSGIRLEENSTVVLDIAAGVTLTSQGGNGTDDGAGAGIEVPPSSTLYVIGNGCLNAIGGKGGDGLEGKTGSSPGIVNIRENWYQGGVGGAGGNGGGGGGAAIGGRGGRGGLGGGERIGPRDSCYYDHDHMPYDGYSGKNGEGGSECGTVYFASNVILRLVAGGAGSQGGRGGFYSGCASDAGSGWNHDYYAAGGGGGGGGGAGYAAEKIGSGGGGGGGGGGGCSGGVWSKEKGSTEYKPGKGGSGGSGAMPGSRGFDGTPQGYISHGIPGAGGSGGSPATLKPVFLTTRSEAESGFFHTKPLSYSSSDLVVTETNSFANALAVAAADSNLVGPDGRRAITFAMSYCPTISGFTVPASAGYLEIDGYNGGQGVSVDGTVFVRAPAVLRHLSAFNVEARQTATVLDCHLQWMNSYQRAEFRIGNSSVDLGGYSYDYNGENPIATIWNSQVNEWGCSGKDFNAVVVNSSINNTPSSKVKLCNVLRPGVDASRTNGVWVWRNDDYSSIAVSDTLTSPKRALRGDANRATILLRNDVDGVPRLAPSVGMHAIPPRTAVSFRGKGKKEHSGNDDVIVGYDGTNVAETVYYHVDTAQVYSVSVPVRLDDFDRPVTRVDGKAVETAPYAASATVARKLTVDNTKFSLGPSVESEEISVDGTVTLDGALTVRNGFRAKSLSGFGALDLNGGIELGEGGSLAMLKAGSSSVWNVRTATPWEYSFSAKADGFVDLKIPTRCCNDSSGTRCRIAVNGTAFSEVLVNPSYYSQDIRHLIPVRAGDSVEVLLANAQGVMSMTPYYFGAVK